MNLVINNNLIFEQPLVSNYIVEQVFSNMWVHGAQRVVQEVDIGVIINGPC